MGKMLGCCLPVFVRHFAFVPQDGERLDDVLLKKQVMGTPYRSIQKSRDTSKPSRLKEPACRFVCVPDTNNLFDRGQCMFNFASRLFTKLLPSL